MSSRPKVEKPDMGLKKVTHEIKIGFDLDGGNKVFYTETCSSALEVQKTLDRMLADAALEGITGKPSVATVKPIREGK